MWLFLIGAHLQLTDAIHGKVKPQSVVLQEQDRPVFDLQPPDDDAAADLNIPPQNLTVQ